MELFKLLGRIAINGQEAKDELDGVAKSAEGVGGKIGNALKSFGKFAVGAAAVAATATAAATVALTKSSVQSYAEYEQLVGGVETLFGRASYMVERYADKAYRTAGLSANAYMETVTSFSASLLQSLDGNTVAAAAKANMAITDMADNANKMGSSMESIQNAYQGFAKQNYTMLDNLKLGFGGTKEEMQRLLDKAQEISGFEYDISSYADIVDAIHVVQTEMGITGTTAEEASGTISGSVATAKAAWQNFVTALGTDEKNANDSFERFASAAETALSNIGSAVKRILPNIGTTIQKGVTEVIGKLPGLITDSLPGLLTAVGSLTSSLVEALPGILDAINSAVHSFLMVLIQSWASPETMGKVSSTVLEFVKGTVNFIVQNAPLLLIAAGELIASLMLGLIEGLVEIAGKWGEWIKEHIIQPIKETWGDIKEVGKGVVDSIKEGISEAWDALTSWFKGIWDSLFGNLTANIKVTKTESVSSSGNDEPVRGKTIQGFATGLDFVPYDEFPAHLHKGEMVLPASQANVLRSGGSLGNNGGTEELVALLYGIKDALEENLNKGTVIRINERELGRTVRGLVNA